MRFNEESFIYRIMGIDNGSSLLGMVIVDLDLKRDHYHVIHKDTFVAEKLISNHRGSIITHSACWARQLTLRDELTTALRFYNPHAVAVETPFFMPKRVQSFKTLTEMMVMIRLAVEEHNPTSDIYGVTPGEAKRAVQPVNFTMKKAVIKDCVLALGNVTYSDDIRKDDLTEHEYDAIAVAVSHGRTIRKSTGFLR